MKFKGILGYVEFGLLYEYPECKKLGTIKNRMGHEIENMLLGYMLVEPITPGKFRLLNYCPYYT